MPRIRVAVNWKDLIYSSGECNNSLCSIPHPWSSSCCRLPLVVGIIHSSCRRFILALDNSHVWLGKKVLPWAGLKFISLELILMELISLELILILSSRVWSREALSLVYRLVLKVLENSFHSPLNLFPLWGYTSLVLSWSSFVTISRFFIFLFPLLRCMRVCQCLSRSAVRRKHNTSGVVQRAEENGIITSFFGALRFQGCSLNLLLAFWESHYILDSYGACNPCGALLAPSFKFWNYTAVLFFWTREWAFTLTINTYHRVEFSFLFQPIKAGLKPSLVIPFCIIWNSENMLSALPFGLALILIFKANKKFSKVGFLEKDEAKLEWHQRDVFGFDQPERPALRAFWGGERGNQVKTRTASLLRHSLWAMTRQEDKYW